MSEIKNIIDFYSGHDVSDDIQERVFERISVSMNEQEAHDALLELWNKADSAYMDCDEVDAAYDRFAHKYFNTGKSRVRTLYIKYIRPAAVIVAVVFIATFASLYVIKQQQRQLIQSVAMQQVHTHNEETKSLTLSDGTKVALKESTVLLHPSQFIDKERKVFLTGEASFDIQHDDNHPFHVSTPYLEITDLGTSFDVSSYPDKEETSVLLREGKLSLQVVGEDKTYEMNPNDCFTYNVKTKLARLEKLSAEAMQSWMDKELDFNDLPMKEVAALLEKNYGVNVTFASRRFQETRITAHFNKGESLADVMRIIKRLIPGMHYTINEQEVSIR